MLERPLLNTTPTLRYNRGNVIRFTFRDGGKVELDPYSDGSRNCSALVCATDSSQLSQGLVPRSVMGLHGGRNVLAVKQLIHHLYAMAVLGEPPWRRGGGRAIDVDYASRDYEKRHRATREAAVVLAGALGTGWLFFAGGDGEAEER